LRHLPKICIAPAQQVEIPVYHEIVTNGQRRRPISSGVRLYFYWGRAKTARVLPQPEPFRAFNSDDLSRFGLLSPDDREIDLGIKGDVEIVREDVDRHVRDDFTNLCLSKPGLLCLHQIGITDVSALLQ
jgi:hypothetical protein